MKITRFTLYVVNAPETRWWWSDDVYGQPYHQRAEHGVATAFWFPTVPVSAIHSTMTP
jgi:hypothetical protein